MAITHRWVVFRHECYGFAGKTRGHKIWVKLTDSREKLEELADTLWIYYKDQPVVLGHREFKPTELTVFFYFNRQPETDADNWVADKVVEVSA